jgi:hypothetical protein
VSTRFYRRSKDRPEFQKALAEARREALRAAINTLHGSAGPASRTLKRNLKAKRAADQIKAATAIVDRAMRGAELLDVVTRLAALEAAAKSQGAAP